MLKLLYLILVLFIFFIPHCFSQESSNSVHINQKVEVVEYDYEYVFVEFLTSLHFTPIYPLVNLGDISTEQRYFEQGRNVRPGYEFGISQSIKAGCWALTTGISYQRYNELFSYNEYETREVTLQNQDGSITSTVVAVGEPVLNQRTNLLGYLKIPLGVGYYPEFFKSKLGFKIGVNYHYLLTTDYWTKYSITIPASVLPQSDFSSSYFSLTGGVSFQMKVYRNFTMAIEPYFDWGLNNMIDQSDLAFGLHTVGLQMAIAFRY